MNSAAATFSGIGAQEKTRTVSWQLITKLAGVACLPIGLIWDISWHMSIGRDTFWTPAHITIQLGGIIPALLFAFEALNATFFGPASERAGRVRLWGAYCSLGGWVTMWGAASMLLSAPFDDWWHNTYGLDVKIVSPPHAVLGLGMFAVTLGVLLDLLRAQNRASHDLQQAHSILFTISVGLVVTMLSIYATEFTWPNKQHSGDFYKLICSVFPVMLVLAGGAARVRWGATLAALTCLIFMSVALWVLPLFPAQPKLAPIYNPITHMVPLPFPLLLLVPAAGLDVVLLWRRKCLPMERAWLKDFAFALLLALIFFGLVFPVQWNFSKFLLSPAADNWFFGGNRNWPYYIEPGPWNHQFWEREGGPANLRNLSLAVGFAFLSARAGLAVGGWMVRVKR